MGPKGPAGIKGEPGAKGEPSTQVSDQKKTGNNAHGKILMMTETTD